MPGALVIQHAQCMYHILLPSVASMAVQNLSTLSHKRHDFRRKVTVPKLCFNFL